MNIQLGSLTINATRLIVPSDEKKRQNPGGYVPLFRDAIQFDTKDVTKIEPLNADQLCIVMGKYTGGNVQQYWEIHTKGRGPSGNKTYPLKVQLPPCLCSLNAFLGLGNSKMKMERPVQSPKEAKFWFRLSRLPYLDKMATNEDMTDPETGLLAWWSRVLLWLFKTIMTDPTLTPSWRRQSYKPPTSYEGWKTMMEDYNVFDFYRRKDDKGNFIRGEEEIMAKSSVFFPVKSDPANNGADALKNGSGIKKFQQPGSSMRTVSENPEIRNIEEALNLTYNNLPIEVFDFGAVPRRFVVLSEADKAAFFAREDVLKFVYALTTGLRFGDNGKGNVKMEPQIKRIRVLGVGQQGTPAWNDPTIVPDDDNEVVQGMLHQAFAAASDPSQPQTPPGDG